MIAESAERIIVGADINVGEEVPEGKFEAIVPHLESPVKAAIPNIAYSKVCAAPKFSQEVFRWW
jgi:hypothetical protein